MKTPVRNRTLMLCSRGLANSAECRKVLTYLISRSKPNFTEVIERYNDDTHLALQKQFIDTLLALKKAIIEGRFSKQA